VPQGGGSGRDVASSAEFIMDGSRVDFYVILYYTVLYYTILYYEEAKAHPGLYSR
jgi:hypothetical protein